MNPTQPTTLVRLRAPLVAREGQWLVVAPDGGVRAHDADDLIGLLAAALAPGYRVCGPVRVVQAPELVNYEWRQAALTVDVPPGQGERQRQPVEEPRVAGTSGHAETLLGLLARCHPARCTAAVLGAHVEVTPQSAHFHLKKLADAGLLTVDRTRRAWRFGLTERGLRKVAHLVPVERDPNRGDSPHDRVLYALYLRGRTSSAASLTPMLPQDNPKAVAQHLVTLSKGALVTQLRSKIGLPHIYQLTAEGHRAMADGRPVPGVVAPQPELPGTTEHV